MSHSDPTLQEEPAGGSRFGLRGFLNLFNRRSNEIPVGDHPLVHTPEFQAYDSVDAKPDRPPHSAAKAPGSSEKTGQRNVFVPGLLIEGNVTSESDLLIGGIIRGNVTCHSDIELCGEVTGNIEGRNITIKRGSVTGNVHASENLSVENCSVKGNLSSRHARINNFVEGDITVCGTLCLLHQADVRGNITAQTLSVAEGAALSGRVTIEQPVMPEKSPFKPLKDKGSAPDSKGVSSSDSQIAESEPAADAAHRPESVCGTMSLHAVSSCAVVTMPAGTEEPESKDRKFSTVVAAILGIGFFGGLLLTAIIKELLHVLNT